MFRIRFVVPRSELLSVYLCLAHSHLIYLLEAYGATCRSILLRLFVLQKSFLKIVFGLPRLHFSREPFEPVRPFKVLSLKALYYLGLLVLSSSLVFGRDPMLKSTKVSQAYGVRMNSTIYESKRFKYQTGAILNERFLHQLSVSD